MSVSVVSSWLRIAAVSFEVLAMAQTPAGPRNFASASLVRPVSGAPLSVTQIETWTTKLPTGELHKDVRESEIYRDRSGRMRIETTLRGPLDELVHLVQIVDPVEGFMAMLEATTATAFRLRAPTGDASFLGFSIANPGIPRPGKDRKTEKLGSRVIEGIDFEGSRTTVIADDRPPDAISEQWTSAELGLIGVIESSDPKQTYSAKIQRVKRMELDPALFSIPAAFTVEDLK
jgi:hypothetical protein